ncbi:TonB-dependent receptor domain-containing protein [Sphingopyxis sp.]|uniref:TonB-dependent receptor domain-containing protein n=1 Tax=Sphingopyxis sp. TaxID=1908224 RepID=UPI0035B18D77
MSKPMRLVSMLLISTALVAPAAAMAQAGPAAETPAPEAGAAAEADTAPADDTDVSIPGADIVVTGRRNANIERTAPQVVSVLGAADIARTGEGNIAGALGRVTGLSVVGNGFVYVRGLGDRYSLALLNGSPLPSPEPLKRVVPLDIFPSSIIASSLVQKSYSANFPGEFGGGVINLTTKAVPREPFLQIGGQIGGNSETTGQLGYTYYGTGSDWTGFGDGGRSLPPAYAAWRASGLRINDPGVNQQAIAGQFVTARNALLQRNDNMPVNWGANVTGGKAWDLGVTEIGLIATAGYTNKWRSRDVTQQTANASDLSSLNSNVRRVITDNRVVANALIGLSAEFGENKVRWTNLYIRDTIKQARLGAEDRPDTADANPGVSFQYQDTAWFARQLIDTQFVGEFKPYDDLSVDVRAGYANSQREAPFELSFLYSRSNSPTDPYGQFFTNTLNTGQRPGSATIAFSDLNENLYSAGIDFTYEVTPRVKAVYGYAYSDTNRVTERRDFLFQGNNNIPLGVSLLRPDLLLSQTVICFPPLDPPVDPNCPANPSPTGISLVDSTGSNPTFRAILRNHAAYFQLQADLLDQLNVNIGARYETAVERVSPVQVYDVSPTLPPATNLSRDYLLPAATLTYEIQPQMQVRLSASKTIARPQFRELVFQTYYDPDTNRTFQGNPQLVDSQLYNAEGRFEWYFAPEQRVSIGGFWKKIKNPIETYASFDGNSVTTRFANAPEATLYGAEFEIQKYFDLSGWGELFASRRGVFIGNYTWSKSKLKVGADDPVRAFPFTGATLASQFFRDGAPLTGQSDHLANVELGLEDTEKLSQQTILISYASDRVTRRGPSGQPDIFERPGFQIDFVARQGIMLTGKAFELKFEARNILGTKYKEMQQSGDNTIYYNLYKPGTTFSLSGSVKF